MGRRISPDRIQPGEGGVTTRANAVFIVALISLAIGSCISFVIRFDTEEAAVVSGETREAGAGWALVLEDGMGMEVPLPRAVMPERGNPIFLRRNLPPGYSGLIMEVSAENAAISAEANGIPLGKAGESSIQLSEMPKGAEITLILKPTDPEKSIYIRGITVLSGDGAVIRKLRGSLLQTSCCVIILLCMAAFSVLETVGARRGGKTSLKPAPFGAVSFICCLCATGIPAMLYGNGGFFESIRAISIISMPVFYFHGHEDMFTERDKTAGEILLWAGTVTAAAGILVSTSIIQPAYAEALAMGALLAETAYAACLSASGGKTKTAQVISEAMALAYAVLSIAEITPVTPWNFNGIRPVLLSMHLAGIAICMTIWLVRDYRDAIESSEKQAVAASEAKSRFLADMSHEIRTPINAVLGMDEMILKESSEPEILEYAADIQSAGRSLLSLVNDVLDISKIESGKMELAEASYNPAEVFRDAAGLIKPKAVEKNLSFQASIDPQIPAGLYGDESKLRRVLTNLLSNAVKYTARGRIWLRAEWTQAGSGWGILRCEVGDTGTGIKKEDIPKLFREYERIEEEKHHGTEGTGLGMSITVSMLKLMGTGLHVKTSYGKGSLFWFEVQQSVEDPSPIGDLPDKAGPEESTEPSFTAPSAEVMVVDDNRMNRKVFKGLLKKTRMRIDEAESGKECLKLAASRKYDIIFLDYMMPDIDGPETLARLRALRGPNARTPVLALTANATAESRDECLKAGFDGYLTKPVPSKKLEEAIKNALPGNKIGPAPVAAQKKQAKDITLPEIKGLDTEYLMLRAGDKRTAMMFLKEFLRGAGPSSTKAEMIYAGLPGSVAEYGIQTHAMKSAAASIGALETSALAKALESTAKEGDVDAIRALHGRFIREWREVADSIAGATGIKKQAKGGGDPQRIPALAKISLAALENGDIDRADEATQKITGCARGTPAEEAAEALAFAVQDIDVEKAREAYRRLLEKAEDAGKTFVKSSQRRKEIF